MIFLGRIGEFQCDCDCKECGKNDVCLSCDFPNCMCTCCFTGGVKYKQFIEENQLDPEFWNGKLMSISQENDSGKFILNLEFIGDDHYLDACYKQDIIQWMKLTQKLLGYGK